MIFNRLSCLFVILSIMLTVTNADNLPIDTQVVKQEPIQEKLSQLESSSGGRIGIYTINTANNEKIQYRADEKFPFCSTSKVMAVAAILKQSQMQANLLQKQIKYSQHDLDKSGYAPITKYHLHDGMSIAKLSEAALDYSDNSAMNLLIKILGNTQAITSYARSIQDNNFSLDRWEPELNSAIPGDNRDTTTPSAMANSLKQLVIGNALESRQRQQLTTWLKNNTTGNLRIRAGVPKDWVVGDKTGTGAYGTTNDIGVVWPTGCAPIIIVIYFTQHKKNAAPRDQIVASATRILIRDFARSDRCLKSQ